MLHLGAVIVDCMQLTYLDFLPNGYYLQVLAWLPCESIQQLGRGNLTSSVCHNQIIISYPENPYAQTRRSQDINTSSNSYFLRTRGPGCVFSLGNDKLWITSSSLSGAVRIFLAVHFGSISGSGSWIATTGRRSVWTRGWKDFPVSPAYPWLSQDGSWPNAAHWFRLGAPFSKPLVGN